MSSEIVRAGFDAWAQQDKPSLEHPREKVQWLHAGERETFLWMKSPVPRGGSVISATLTLRAKGASSGSRTLSVKRVAESWKERSLNWNKRPTTTGTAATKTVGALADRDAISFDVTAIVQSWASGASNFGFKITTDAGTRHAIYGLLSSYKPTLSVEWSDAPAKPTNLRPSDAAISVAQPFLVFDYLDVSGDTSLGAVRVQIDAAASEATAWDSGYVSTTVAGLDLATVVGAPSLALDASTYWRVMARDGAGLDSSWSDWVPMTRKAKGSVSITNLGAGKFTEPTPPVLWSSTGQTRYEVLVYDLANPETAIHSSGVKPGTATAYTIPEGVLKSATKTYRVEVRVWDDVYREATPTDPTYASATADCVLAKDASVAPVATLSAAQVDLSPWVDLTWTRSVTPDAFALYRDGVPVKAEILPEDVFVSGSTYRYRYYGARPNRAHEYEVVAVVNGVQSASNATTTLTTSPSGLWIVDFDRGVDVTLWGDDEGTWTMQDDASVYTPVGSTQVVRIVNGMRGLEGSLSGLLMEGFGKTFEEQEADLYEIKSRPTQTVRIIAGDENFTALIGNVKISPKPETRQGRIVKGVSLDFWQVGALPFDPKI